MNIKKFSDLFFVYSLIFSESFTFEHFLRVMSRVRSIRFSLVPKICLTSSLKIRISSNSP